MARTARRAMRHHERHPQTRSNPAGVAKPIRGYSSNSVRVGARLLLFISGQVALDPEGRVVGKGDVRAQTVQVLESILAILRANGADMQDRGERHGLCHRHRLPRPHHGHRMQYFPSNGPSSAIVEIAKLAMPELLIEIAAVAAVS